MTTLAAQLADGMRTPLTCILGYVELLLDDPAGTLSDEQRRHLAVVTRSAHALERLAAAAEAVAEGEDGHAARTRVDLAALVGSVNAARPDVHVGPVVPVACTGDPEALAQMLDHLVACARDHAAGGATTLSLRRLGARAVIRVRGTRDGRPALPAPEGLGLAAARAIATAHGGRLTTIIGSAGTLTLRCELAASPAE